MKTKILTDDEILTLMGYEKDCLTRKCKCKKCSDGRKIAIGIHRYYEKHKPSTRDPTLCTGSMSFYKNGKYHDIPCGNKMGKCPIPQHREDWDGKE